MYQFLYNKPEVRYVLMNFFLSLYKSYSVMNV